MPVAPRPSAPAPGAPAAGPRPSSFRGKAGPPGADRRPAFRSGPPRPPPTAEQVIALAKKERVPARIAKGDLEGKMKCRIWKKLHAEESKRFDQAYDLMGQHPSLELADAFGALQSGLKVEDFLARKSRTQKKAAVKEARGAVTASEVDGFIAQLIADKTELSVVLAERTLLDVLKGVERVAFELEKQGRLEKLQVVLMCRRSLWESLAPDIGRDPKLSQKPLPIARQPEKRPVSDPRPFAEHVGKVIHLTLRNGLELRRRLACYGPFDIILGDAGEELFVPLHAIAQWEPEPGAP
ncbi:MAG: hypothetical protein ACYC8T_29750 [Myxococcaceae bacterium]